MSVYFYRLSYSGRVLRCVFSTLNKQLRDRLYVRWRSIRTSMLSKDMFSESISIFGCITLYLFVTNYRQVTQSFFS